MISCGCLPILAATIALKAFTGSDARHGIAAFVPNLSLTFTIIICSVDTGANFLTGAAALGGGTAGAAFVAPDEEEDFDVRESDPRESFPASLSLRSGRG